MKREPRAVKAARTITPILWLVIMMNAARADWRIDFETGALYDSNLSNSDRAREEEADFSWQSDLQFGQGFQLSRDLRLNLAAQVHGQVWSQYDAFNNVRPGAAAGLRYRFGLGRMAPWVLLEDRVGYAVFHEDERSGLDNRLNVRAGLAITERLAVEVAYTFDVFDGKDSFWDLSGHTGSIRITFDATSSLQLALGFSHREGEVFSYALPPRPDIVALAAESKPVGSFDRPPYTAYRVDGSTNAFSASAGYILSRNISVQVNYEFRHTASGSLKYENHLVEARIVFAY